MDSVRAIHDSAKSLPINANGVLAHSPGLVGFATYPGYRVHHRRPTPKGLKTHAESIPDKSFVEFDVVLLKHRAQLVLIGHLSMVVLMMDNVIADAWTLRLTDRERTVAGLPMN